MSYRQEITFTGGRNTDDDLKSLPQGDFLYAYNCHIGVTDQSHQGSVENVKGNTLVTFPLPVGTNRCIGRCKDAQRKAIVFFLYNSTGQHSIRRFYVDSGLVELIIQDPVLGFRPERKYRIHSSNIVEEKLYWTNLALFPCKLNMDRAIGYLNRLYFSDNNFVSGGFVSFVATSSPFGYNVGDTITVVQTPVPGYNPAYDGFATITAIVGNLVITDIPWGGSTPITPGYFVLSSAYSIIDQQVIDALKRPPNFPPTLQYSTDLTTQTNSLKKILPQVSYRYIYDDYEKSAWSPYSKLGLPQGDETFDGELFGTSSTNNTLSITINTGSHIVKKIEIGVRFGNINDFVSVVILDKNELGFDDDLIYAWTFKNINFRGGIDQKDIRRPFDNLPQTARGQELLSENVMAYGGCEEGYDNIKTEIELALVEEAVAYNNQGRDDLPYVITNIPTPNNIYPNLSRDRMDLTIDTLPTVGSIIRLSFTWQETLNFTPPLNVVLREFIVNYVVTATDVAAYPSLAVLLQNIANIISNLHTLTPFPVGTPPMLGPYNVVITSNGLLVEYPFAILLNVPTVRIWTVISAGVKTTGHKTGAYHSYGLVYMDRGNRSGTVNEDRLTTPSKIYVPFPTEQLNWTSNAYRTKVGWEIKHTPPDWATHYSWYYTGNAGILDCTQYIIKNITLRSDSTGVLGISLTFLNNHQSRFIGSRVPAFVFDPNNRSRIRFLTTATTNIPNGIGSLITTYIDLEIIGVDAVDPDIVYVNNFDFQGTQPGIVGTGSLVEIYTPKADVLSGGELFFEKGEVYEIGNPHTPQRYHKGEIQDQNPSNPTGVPATGVFERGDIYHITRGLNPYSPLGNVITGYNGSSFIVAGNCREDIVFMGVFSVTSTSGTVYEFQVQSASYDTVNNTTEITPVGAGVFGLTGQTIDNPKGNIFPQALVESFSYSDFYESKAYDKGRPNIVSPDTRRKYLNIVRHSQKYLQETKINGLNTFYDESVQFSDAFGTINKIIEVGYTLKVIQDQKCTSVYIGRTVTNLPDGTSQVLGTNTILGTTIPQIENYGTIHPESVHRHERYLYYYDCIGSRYIRDAANGPQVVSDYKMKTYFRDKTIAINQIGSDNVHVFSEWDDTFKKLLVTFWFTNTIFESVLSETIAFHESQQEGDGKNRWRETYPYYPEEFGQFGQTLISFKNGELWVHNTNPVYNNFYGVQYDQKIRFAMNLEKEKHKVLGSMAVYSTEKWYAPTNYIQIPAHAEYPGGMSSRILANKFIHKQGCWYAEFSRDANTPNANPLTVYLNGRKLSGYVADIMIKNDHLTYVLLDQVIIQSVPSEKSK